MADIAAPTLPAVIEGEYMMEAKEFDAAGKSRIIKASVPETADFSKWSLMQQVVMLKKGGWLKSPINEIIFGIAYAHSLGLDVMRGDVFPTGEGRLGISNKAKIKLALETGNILGIETSMRDTGKPIDFKDCVLKTDLECTVTITVKGWAKPIVRKALLSRWYKGSNPNWKGNPEHMLELNTIAHACEYVNPTATEDDEAPPLTPAVDTATEVAVALKKAKETIETTTTTTKENA